MPIRIDYSPVGTLMNLARSAGEAQGARESAAHDLAFTQMAMQAQVQNAQIGATMQRNDQAFQLQQAALARQSRTPTRATPSTSPVAQDIDKALGRATVTRGWEQQDQQQQMEQLDRIPGLTERERESIRLGIMGGQSLTTLLKERTDPSAREEGLTPAQKESRRRTLYSQRRGDLEAELKHHRESSLLVGAEKDAKAREKRIAEITTAIKALDTEYGTTESTDTTGTGLNLEVLNTPQPMPASKAEAKVGQVYVADNDDLYRWSGSYFVPIK